MIVGDLTIKGISKTIILESEIDGPITDMQSKTRIGISASTEISRKDFGLTWNRILESGTIVVGDRVKIELSMEAIKI